MPFKGPSSRSLAKDPLFHYSSDAIGDAIYCVGRFIPISFYFIFHRDLDLRVTVRRHLNAFAPVAVACPFPRGLNSRAGRQREGKKGGMSEEARDDDNASSEKGRDGIFMEHYHSRTDEE